MRCEETAHFLHNIPQIMDRLSLGIKGKDLCSQATALAGCWPAMLT